MKIYFQRNNVPDEYYAIDELGGGELDGVGMIDNRWATYYSERGKKRNKTRAVQRHPLSHRHHRNKVGPHRFMLNMTEKNTTTPRRQPLIWARTEFSEFPYELRSDGHVWQIRINDFPAEPMYTLLIDGKEIDNLDDWPTVWKKV